MTETAPLAATPSEQSRRLPRPALAMILVVLWLGSLAGGIAIYAMAFAGPAAGTYAGITEQQARERVLSQARAESYRTTSGLLVVNATRGFDPMTGEDAWIVGLRHASGFGSVALCAGYASSRGIRIPTECRR